MSKMKVMSLRGMIEDIKDSECYSSKTHRHFHGLRFAKVEGEDEANAFHLRRGLSLPIGTQVDLVSIVHAFSNGRHNTYQIYGVKKDGQVIFDLTKDGPKGMVRYMVPEARALFSEAQRLLYEKLNVQISKKAVKQITTQLARGAQDSIRAGYLTGRLEGDNIVVEGVFVPEQESNKVATQISPETQARSIQSLKADGKTIIGFVQYNGPFQPYESATTRETRKELSQLTGCPDMGIVVNARNQSAVFN